MLEKKTSEQVEEKLKELAKLACELALLLDQVLDEPLSMEMLDSIRAWDSYVEPLQRVLFKLRSTMKTLSLTMLRKSDSN